MKSIALALTMSLFTFALPSLACDKHSGSGSQDDKQKEHHHDKPQSKDHQSGHEHDGGQKTENPDSKQQEERSN